MIKRVSVLVLISIFCSCFFFKFVFAEDYITEKEIMNFTYHLTSLKGSFTLNDGKFKSGSSSENFVEVYIFDYKIVDLDGDGVNDAVVILKASYGSSIFTEITVLLKNSNGIVQTNSVLVGDKVEIKNFSIKKRRLSSGIPLVWLPAEINLNIIRQESNDTMIKPTKLEEKCLNLYKNALIDCEELEHYHIVKKPAIYLYPTKKQKVFLKVNANGTLTKTIPEYKDGWDITANPNGKINNRYNYLFYEVKLTTKPVLKDERWVVSRSELSGWFNKYLPELGLKGREIKDFKAYWLKELPKCNYYEIRPLDEDFLDKNLTLEINPNPDTIIRVILYFKCSSKGEKQQSLPISKKKRIGFTVVEWGGITENIDIPNK